MSRILISYSYVDKPHAEQLRTELQTRGYEVFTDADLQPGKGGINLLLQLIVNADAMIILLSRAALDSQWLVREIEFGQQNRKPLIPVLLEQIRIPDNLANYQYVDATGDWQPALEKIVLALEASVGLRQIARSQAPTAPYAPATAQRTSKRRLGMLLVLLGGLLAGLVAILIIGQASPTASDGIGQPIGNSFNGQYPTPTSPFVRRTAIPTRIPTRIIGERNTLPPTWTPTNPVTSDGASATIIATDATLAPATVEAGPDIVDQTETAVSIAAQATSLVRTATVQAQLVPTANVSPTLDNQRVATEIGIRMEQTFVAFRATEANVLSPAEGAQLFEQLAARLPQTNQAAGNNDVWMVLIGVAVAVIGMGAMAVTTRTNWFLRRPPLAVHGQGAQAQPNAAKLPPLLEDFQIFVSSSEADKAWIRPLVEDMTALGYLVWWYAKDAPGLSFGREIQSAIYHTKVFVVIVSPDSMASKHVEEEIRWAEIYDRPVIPVVYRFVDARDRLYGLAKRSAIDFTDEKAYKASIEQVTHAVDHYLKQRLEGLQRNGADTDALSSKN